MSLFPAYRSLKCDEEDEVSKESVSLSWLTNRSCPPEVGQIPLPPPVTSELPVDEKNEVQESQDENEAQESQASSVPPKKKKKEKSSDKSVHKARKKEKREKKAKKHHSRSKSRSSSSSYSRSRSPYRRRLSSRSRSTSKTRLKSPKRKSRKRSLSRSKLHSKSRSRNHSRSSTRSSSRSRSRARSHNERSRSRARSKPKQRKESQANFQSSNSRSRSRSKSSSRSRRKGKLKEKYKLKSEHSSARVCSKQDGFSKSKTRSEILVTGSKSVFLEDLNGLVKPEDAFHIDTSGDSNNLAFSSTHFSQLARYKVKNRKVLGYSALEERKLRSKKKEVRYFKRAAQRMLYCNASLIKNLPQRHECTENDSVYIPLELSYLELKEIKEEKDSSNLHQLKTDQFMLDLDTVEEDKSDDVEYAYWQGKLKEYNEKLGKEPSNVSLWLEFVKFQDEAYKHLFNEDKKDKKKKKVSLKALAERKISILDSAIKKNIRSLDLQFERLTVGQDIWEDKKLKQEWSSLIFNFPNKMSVWHQYLVFTQTHFTSFSLTSVISTFAKCTEKLQQMKSGVFLTHSPPPEIGKCLIDVTVQLAYVWKQAGFMERSVALFQALIELNLFAPAHAMGKNITLEARLTLFEPFWDSRSPRFGEEKATGWAQVMDRRQQIEFPEVILSGTRDEEDDILAQGGTTSHLWLALETSRERCHWLPWGEDPEDCEDPERMVSFEDLSPHLFILDTVQEKFYLILNFFKFLGLPYVHDILSGRQCANKKSAKSENAEICDIFKPLTLENLYDDNLFGRTCNLNFGDAGGQEIFNFPEIGPTLLNISCADYYAFACELLQQASLVMQQPYKTDLTILYIKLLGLKFVTMRKGHAVNLPSLSKEIKKKVKNILKSEEFRACLPIYQEYGKLEEIMEHYDESENVYTTALSIGTATGKALDITSPNFKGIMDLYKSYIQLEIKKEAQAGTGYYTNNVIFSLCSLVLDGKFVVISGSSASGAVILKTKKQLQEMQDSYLSSLSQDNSCREKDSKLLLATQLTNFLAILQLLTVGFKSACLIYETTIRKLEDGVYKPTPHKLEDIVLPGEVSKKYNLPINTYSVNKPYLLENVINGYLWLVELSLQIDHIVKGEKITPANMRSLLALAVKVAPENPKFLLQFTLNQTWRDLLGGVEIISKKSSSILVLVSQILPHLQRTVSLIVNTDEGVLSCGHRLESVLERGVGTLPGRHCPLLWRIYLSLVATTRPSGLKQLIYRAIASCPGVKSVYLDCIRLMPEMLKEIVTLLGEKGVRVRLPLEELQVLTETELDLGV